MLFTIKADLSRYKNGANNSFFSIFLHSQGFRYMFFRRIRDHYGKKSFLGLFASFFLRHYTYKYGFQIGGQIGPGFYIGHFGTIVVSSNAVIGKNCNIAHGVTIGASRRGEKKGAPKLGNYVWIGTNAIIVGGITIGSDVLIAPGAYVNFDVPDHSIVIGNPGKIIIRENATEGYINNVLNKL